MMSLMGLLASFLSSRLISAGLPHSHVAKPGA